jgi:hypothetical protein
MGLGVSIAVDGNVDAELSDAATVEVHERMGRTTTFRLTYPVDIDGGDLPLLTDERLGPGSKVAVLVPLGDKTHCLVQGPVCAQRIHLMHGGAGSYVEVEGSDSSVTMDREDNATVWDSTSDSDAVSTLIGQYEMDADVDDTAGVRDEDKHALVQRSTDLAFIRRLASRNGFIFWVTADSNGTETAHFKAPPFDQDPGQTLTINLDQPSLASIELHWDVERATSALADQLDLNDLSDIDGDIEDSSLAALGSDTLADITGDTRSAHLAVPVDDSGDLQARGQALLAESTAFVVANTETTVAALNDIVRAHTVVRLDGLGTRHSGSYFVSSVRHVITAEQHRMELELLRNAWGTS